jgi:UrcA family protein
MSSFINPRGVRWLALGAAALSVASTGVAQPVVVQTAPEQIVIVGHYRKLPDNVQSASLAVGYGDLDLSLPSDRALLRHRIALTARYLCDRLGESDDATPGSCRAEAVRDAMERIGTIEEHFAPRGTAWVRPPAWSAPYPQGWVTQYP